MFLQSILEMEMYMSKHKKVLTLSFLFFIDIVNSSLTFLELFTVLFKIKWEIQKL